MVSGGWLEGGWRVGGDWRVGGGWVEGGWRVGGGWVEGGKDIVKGGGRGEPWGRVESQRGSGLVRVSK